VFIDKDGFMFDYMLNLLRGYPEPQFLLELQSSTLASDLKYFCLSNWVQWDNSSTSLSIRDYQVLKDVPQCNMLAKTLKQWLGKRKIGKLLFRASAPSFEPADFHAKCDFAAMTVLLAKSVNGCVFGGFAASSWIGAGVWTNAPDCFIFSLHNTHNIAPIMFRCTVAENALCCNPGYGPIFGRGHDMYLQPSMTAGFNFNSYGPDTTGRGALLFAGSTPVQLSMFEVFEVTLYK
jgi:hypothetical protein